MEPLDTGQKLDRMERMRNDDGTVNLELMDWEEDDGTVYFDFIDPQGEEYNESCDLPRSRDEDVLFNHLLDHTGWEFSTADQMKDESIPAKPTDNGYDVLPGRRTIREKVRDFFDREKTQYEFETSEKWFMAIFHPIAVFGIAADRSNGWTNDYDNGWMDGVLAVWLWVIIIIVFLLLLL